MRLLIIFSLLCSYSYLFAFDTTIGENSYRLSSVPQYMGPDGDSNYYSEWHVIAAQPWYGNQSLAASLSSQVGNSLIVEGKVPVFIFNRNGPYFNHAEFPTGISHPAGDSLIYYFVVAKLLIDTDSDGQYDLDDLDDDNDGLTDIEEQLYGTNPLLVDSDEDGISDIKEVLLLVEEEKNSRPTPDEYDSLQAEKAVLESEIATLTSELTDLSNRVFAILPKEVPTPPVLDSTLALEKINEGKVIIEDMKNYHIDDFYSLDLFVGWAEDDIASENFSGAIDELEDIIRELSYPSLLTDGAHGVPSEMFSQAKEKFELAKIFIETLNSTLALEKINEGKVIIEDMKNYHIDDFYSLDLFVGWAEDDIASENFSGAIDELEDIIRELSYPSLLTDGAHGVPSEMFSQAKEKFELALNEISNLETTQASYDPSPVASATLEEHITSLNSQIDNAQAESDEKLALDEVRDLRLGSTMIEVSGNQATVQLQMEESSDLQTWEDAGDPATMTIPADTDTKFFRFKMAD